MIVHRGDRREFRLLQLIRVEELDVQGDSGTIMRALVETAFTNAVF
jgi:hypothetical protein